MSIFYQKIKQSFLRNKSVVCIGLDSQLELLPISFKSHKYPQFAFNQAIIDATADLVMAYKPNSAFYEARGADGILELKMTCDYLHQKYPDIVIILDAKRADIGHTNTGYVEFAFDYLGADAITLHPYLGQEALQPFLDRQDKGCIILCRTSNPGAGELQDLPINKFQIPLYQYVARQVANSWNTNHNCGLVVGATYPHELKAVREIAPDLPILIPGIGAQGGDLKATVEFGLNPKREGIIINVSRSVIFASNQADFAIKARSEIVSLNKQINHIMKELS